MRERRSHLNPISPPPSKAVASESDVRNIDDATTCLRPDWWWTDGALKQWDNTCGVGSNEENLFYHTCVCMSGSATLCPHLDTL